MSCVFYGLVAWVCLRRTARPSASASWSGTVLLDRNINKLFDLRRLPSSDRRYSTALGDIRHRVFDNDWADD